MGIKDVLLLVKAGFDAETIAKLASASDERKADTKVELQKEYNPPAEVDVLKYEKLNDKIDSLAELIQSSNLLGSNMPIQKKESADDILASVFRKDVHNG